jgi:hypothetical protein
MMNRLMLGTLGAAVLALVAWSGLGVRADDKPAKEEHAHGHFDKCAKACADCQVSCDSCFHHCATLVAKGEKDHARTMHTCVDCAECCKLAASLCARQSPFAKNACDCCAKCCDECAKACEHFKDDKHMAACAKSCRDCAAACREMMKHADH